MVRKFLLPCLLVTTGIACHKSAATPIPWEPTLDVSLARAKAEGKPAMVDFTAAWCTACQELEKRTYNQPEVQRAAARFVPIKIDATELDDAMQKTFDRFGVASLPVVLFVDSNGIVLTTPKVTGFVPAPRFVELLAHVH